MLSKKVIPFIFVILLSCIITAQSIKIDLPSTEVEPGEDLTFIATAYDTQNNPTDGQIKIIIEDAEKTKNIQEIVDSKKLANIKLGEDAPQGQWQITAEYNENKITELFFVKAIEKVAFSLDGEMLIIKNTGNVIYSPEISIKIGDTEGKTKNPTLEIGEEVKYRLIAPEGNYNVYITDGKTTLSRSEVSLNSGGLTGDVIGAIDESNTGRSSLTGSISPDATNDEALLGYMKHSKFVYVFILAVFGITILLAIERNFRKKAGK